MRALVTGGAGFIGSHLVDRLLVEGLQVTVLDLLVSGKREHINKNAKFIYGDILSLKFLEASLEDIDVIFHLAAVPSVPKSTKDWIYCHKVNLGGSIHVFEAASHRNIPVIYASSSAIYGDSTSLPLKESESARPTSPYGFDKYSCEVQAKLFADFKNLKSVGLRFFNVYGPRQDPASEYAGAISVFANAIMNDQPIHIFDDGNQERDFIFVKDVVDILVKTYHNLDNLKSLSEVFNVCTQKGTSIKNLVDIMFGIMKRRVLVSHLKARKGDVYRSLGSNDKIHHFLGLQSYTPITDGLKSFLHPL